MDNIRNKSKKELLLELQQAKNAYDSLQLLYQNEIKEKHRIESKLSSNQVISELMFQDHKSMMLLIDPLSGKIIDANNSAVQFYKYPIDQLKGMPIDEINVLSLDQLALARQKAVTKTQNQFIFSHRIASGEIRKVEVHSSPVEMNGQKLLFSIIHDITGRDAADSKLKRSEDALRKAEEIGKFGNWYLFLDEKLMQASDGALLIYGLSQNELPYDKVKEVALSEFRPMLDKALEELILTGKQYDVEYKVKRKSDGKIVDIHSVAEFDASKNIVFGTIQDISERKRTEKALIESEEKFHSLFVNMIEGAALHKLSYNSQGDAEDYVIIEINPAFEVQIGIPREQVINKTSREAYGVADPPFLETYARVALSGTPEVFETYFPPLARYFSISVFSAYKGSFATIFVDITERRKAEQTIRESERRYHGLLDHLNAGIVVHDADTSIVMANPKACELLGLSGDQMTGKIATDPQWQFIRDDFSPMPSEEYPVNKIISSRKPIKDFLIGVQRPVINDVEWLLVNGLPMFDKNGGIKEVLISFTDITERKSIEDNLLESQRLLDEAQRLAQIGVWEWDNESNAITWSEVLCRIVGRDPNLPVPAFKDQQFVFTQQSYEQFAAAIENVKETGRKTELELEIVHSGGSLRNVIGFVGMKYNAKGMVKGLYGTLQDITDRKRAEAKLRETNAYLENLLNYANAPIIVWDPQFRITRFNHAFESLTGRLEADVAGKSLQILFPPELAENSMELIRKTLSGERWETVEIKILNIDSSVRTVLWNSATLFGPDGKTPVATIAQGHDITDRKRVEEEIKTKNEALLRVVAEKDKFFSILAHDLRSPFNGFLGLTQIMAEKLPELTMDEIQKIAVSMRTSATSLFRLLENLLHWARIEQGLIPFNAKRIHLEPLIKESVAMSLEPANKKGIDLVFSVPENLEVFADSNMLQTVIRNLVSNAVKFTATGGKVMLSAKAVADKSVEIIIQDSGIGMSDEILANLFHINLQTNRKGTDGEPSTGLGLIICKEFVEKHGGRLLVESKAGMGSIFRFNLPYTNLPHEKTPGIDSEMPENTTKPPKGLKILIAEDDETSGMLISIALKPFCKTILKAGSGFEAVEICKSNSDIDLIMMDIKMPGLNGYEATRQIREFNKEVFIVAQTAFGKTGDREKAISEGFNEFLSKPLSVALLKELIVKNFTAGE